MPSPEAPIQLQEVLQQFSQWCSFPQHPNVRPLQKLSTHLRLKSISYNGTSYIVTYNTRTKRVALPSDLPCGPIPNAPNRSRYYHNRHTKQRLRERFNIEASKEDLQKMASMCRTKYEHIKIPFRTHSERTKNLIHFKGTDMLAIYEPESDSIVTAMPPEYLDKDERDWLFCSKRVRYKQLLKHTKEL